MKLKLYLIKLKKSSLDTNFGILGLLIGIIIFIESTVYDNNHYHFFIVIFFSSLLYLLFRRKMLKQGNLLISISNKHLFLIGGIVFFLSISSLIWIYYQNVYYRPPVYFFLCLVASIAIIINIFCFNTNKRHYLWFILIEIIILALLIKTSLYYEFSGIYGQDPWWHTQWIKETISAGHITPGNYLPNSYYVFPQFHLLNGITSVVSSLTIKNATFFSVGFIGCSIIPTLFLFLIAKRFTNIMIALLSALLFSLSGYLIERSVSIIPMTLGISFFLIISYLIFYYNIKRPFKKPLLIVFSFSLILTHTIAAFITLLSITALFISGLIYNKLGKINEICSYYKNLITAPFIIFFGTLMLFVWRLDVPSNLPFFDSISITLINALQKGRTLSEKSIVNVPYDISLFYQAAFFTLMFFSIVGSLLYLSHKERDISKWGLLSILIILYGPVLSFTFFSVEDVFLLWRWFVFLIFPLTILGLVGLSRLSNIIRNNATKLFIVGVVVVVIILFSLISPPANLDTPPYFADNAYERGGWTESELIGAKALYNSSCGRVITDISYGNIIPYVIGHSKYDRMRYRYNSVFVWRNYYLHHPEWNKIFATQIHNGRDHLDVTEEKVLISDYMTNVGINHKPLIYSNGNIKVYMLKISSLDS